VHFSKIKLILYFIVVLLMNERDLHKIHRNTMIGHCYLRENSFRELKNSEY